MNNINNIEKINILQKKVLFIGYGAVAKCVWNYFDFYFIYKIDNIYIIDKCLSTIIGPKVDIINNNNILIEDITVNNFNNIIKKIGIVYDDIIIDLTVNSSTYYFVEQCLIYGINYINTSIEDLNDNMLGTSIDFQQKKIINIFKDFSNNNKINSNILLEFGQNPGLIQHYVLYSLNLLNKKKNKSDIDNYDIIELKKVIDDNKIGMILMSEIDNIVKKDTNEELQKKKIYNTWSISGMLSESIDKCELVCGKKNKYIKPIINKDLIDIFKTNCIKNKDYKVFFLKELGINCYLNSICPILDNNNNIKYEQFEGRLIHHGEIFELARLFGENAPFMSYVYKINKYAEQSIKENFKNMCLNNIENLKLYINNNCDSGIVINNFKEKYEGFDSIGCTIFCGNLELEKIYWCGSLLSDKDNNIDKNFTPTIIQVAAGVLSGLSFIMEKCNKNKGLMMSCNLDTSYVLKKSIPLLGKFFFTEIDKKYFDNNLYLKIKKYI
jgi:homospermidine synthase